MMKALMVFVPIAICGSALAQTDSAADALIAKSKAIPQAIHGKDTKALNDLLASDFKGVNSAGQLLDRGEMLGSAEEGGMRDFQVYNAQMTHIDENSAIVNYNLIVTMPEGDDLLAPRYQKISDLWVRTGGDWRLKFEQATPLRPID